MGAVHGVYLKYVGLSALSFAGYVLLTNGDTGTTIGESPLSLLSVENPFGLLSWKHIGAMTLGYSAIVNGTVALLFKLRRGMELLGKNPVDGTIPLWSYIIWFPFHIPTWLYTYIHTKHGKHGGVVPVASEVLPGWWIGGRYSNELDRDWSGVVDLTTEFPELCINRTKSYLLISVWDGVPPTPSQIEKAAQFAADSREHGDVLIHCAHGRGRSTTLTCAALVKAGLFKTWQEAFEGVKPKRPVVKLNSGMRRALQEWQEEYVDSKKEQ